MTLHHPDLTVDSLRPGDDGYDDAARVFFATGEPALVVRPRDADQVASALAYAVRHDLAVSVRSGGHSALGHGTNSGGLVVDLTHLDAIEVLDAERRLVRVGSGATWGRVAAALDPHGWGLTSGDTVEVGVGGLTLGGGIGWLVRRHGLTIDNLVGARVVTADGRLLTASEDEHPDLFWALRGGGPGSIIPPSTIASASRWANAVASLGTRPKAPPRLRTATALGTGPSWNAAIAATTPSSRLGTSVLRPTSRRPGGGCWASSRMSA